MPTLQEQLQTAVEQTAADSNIFHNIVHGNETAEVITENGPVKTIAKVISENQQTLINSINTITEMKNITVSAAQTAIEAAEQAEYAAEGHAENINITPIGNITSSNVQSALEELESKKASKAIANEFTKTQNFTATILEEDEIIDWDLENNQVAIVTLSDDRVLNTPTNMKSGAVYILIVKQDLIGSHALAFNGVFKFADNEVPELSSDANSADIFTFISDGINMYGVMQGGY